MNITTQIQGGLGNQLFQYATGKALSTRLRSPLQLDTNWFNQGWGDATPRQLLLPELKLNYAIAQIESTITPPKRWRRLAQVILPLSPYILSDRPYRFNPKINQFKPYAIQDVYLMGYWQSFRYFDSIRKELISEIRPAKNLSAHYQTYLKKIQSTVSVMVHIRRGDYIHLPAATKVHRFLGLAYYQKGMDLFLEKDPATQFFIFSDDLNWARENLPHQERICFIESTSKYNAPLEELFLMTQCQRHLIANSSLSWWGAWLSSNPSPLVIAPRNWTNDSHKSWDDLLLPQWQRI